MHLTRCLAPIAMKKPATRKSIGIYIISPLLLAACQTTGEPGIEVRVVEKVVEVQRPCPGEKPERPAPLPPAEARPTTLEAYAAMIGSVAV